MDVLLMLLICTPFLAILWLANTAYLKRIEGDLRSERSFKLLAYGTLLGAYAAFSGIGLLLLLLGAIVNGPQGAGLGSAATGAGALDPRVLPRIALGLWVPSLLGVFLLARPVRRFAARFTRLDAENPVHAVALSYAALILMNLLMTLGLGLRNLAAMLESATAAGQNLNPAPGLWVQDIFLALLAMVGVGWLSRRRSLAALHRLGVVLPSWPQAGLGLLVGLVMVPAVVLLEFAAGKVGIGANPDVARLTEQLVGPLTRSIPGILTLGLAAALGEETIFRGALQPRFGIVLTSLLFALLHSNYGITFSTLAVFLLGLALGWLRLRHNTTCSMIAHATYNLALGLIAYLGIMQGV